MQSPWVVEHEGQVVVDPNIWRDQDQAVYLGVGGCQLKRQCAAGRGACKDYLFAQPFPYFKGLLGTFPEPVGR
ncbi:hypothetical protein D3C86_1621780 [compost metagenome]